MPIQIPINSVSVIVLTLSCVLLIPFLTFFLECAAAFLPSFSKPSTRFKQHGNFLSPTLAILVPAHNEEYAIEATLRSILKQITDPDRLIVIADNCTDNTANVARSCGVTVIERVESNPMLRGKGYALDFGLKYIASNPPDVVVSVDADCVVAPGTIHRIAQQAYQTKRPVQATYVMEPPENPSLKDLISALAVVIKNQVRPLGLSRLGCPNLLTGSGMAFPWEVLQQISLAGSKTCDDMQTSIDLAIAGYPVTYSPNTRVTGRLMKNKSAFNQRSRWEHGHLEMFTTQIPRLFAEAIQQRRLDLVALALEIAIPPLSLLVMIWFGALVIAIIDGTLVDFWFPALSLGLMGSLLMVAILGVWLKFERFGLSLLQLLGMPIYALWKIPLYIGYFIQPKTRWLQTERDNPL